MRKCVKTLLCIALVNFVVALSIFCIHIAPSNKAVKWKAENYSLYAVDTRGKTNFSDQINAELAAISPDGTGLPATPAHSVSASQNISLLANGHHLSVVRVETVYYDINWENVEETNGYNKEIGKETFDFYIYVNAKENTLTTQKVVLTDTYTEND